MFIRKPILLNEANIGPVSAQPEDDLPYDIIQNLHQKRSEIVANCCCPETTERLL